MPQAALWMLRGRPFPAEEDGTPHIVPVGTWTYSSEIAGGGSRAGRASVGVNLELAAVALDEVRQGVVVSGRSPR